MSVSLVKHTDTTATVATATVATVPGWSGTVPPAALWTDYRTGARYGRYDGQSAPAGIAAQRAAVADAAAAAGMRALATLAQGAEILAYAELEAHSINGRIALIAAETDAYAEKFSRLIAAWEQWTDSVRAIANLGLWQAQQSGNAFHGTLPQGRVTLPLDGTDRYVMVRTAMAQYVIEQSGLADGLVRRLVRRLCALPVAQTEEQYHATMDTIGELVTEERRDDAICWDGAHRFMQTFALGDLEEEQTDCETGDCYESDCDECRPEQTQTVTLTVEVTVEVTSRDSDADAEELARGGLSVTFDRYTLTGGADADMSYDVTDVTVDY